VEYTADKENKETKPTRLRLQTGREKPPVITVDYERYAHMLEDSDLSEAQKREFLQSLWNVIVEFVSLGFGVHPLQQAENACGKDKENSTNSALTAPNQLYLDHKLLADNFGSAADLSEDVQAKGIES